MDQQDDPLRASLSRFDNDLWIKRRLEVDEILGHLERVFSSGEALKKSAADWIRFFKFLATECSGQNFTTDKQWGEMLILMQINRKLNHQSVKLKDLMHNRAIIESNAKSLRQLNEAAKLSKSIQLTLDRLKNIIQKELLLLLPVAALDDPTIIFLTQINSAKCLLKDKCKPLMRILLADIEDELVTRNPELEVWRIKIRECEKIIASINKFLEDFSGLQSKLGDLEPLLSVQKELNTVDTQETLLSNLKQCEMTFRQVQKLHIDLTKWISQHVLKRRSAESDGFKSLPLIRLLDNSTFTLNTKYEAILVEALERLTNCRSELDKIMKTLRIEFGWFYFVSELELLRIIALDSRLATESEEKENQLLIRKLFNNSINSFILNDSDQLIGVRNPYGEVILLNEEPILIHKQVNIYSLEIVRILNDLMRKLRRSIKSMLFASLEATKLDWNLPIQVMNLHEYVEFTRKVENKLIAGESLSSLVEHYKIRFAELSSAESPNVDEIKHTSISTLIIHFLSRLLNLQSGKVTCLNDWLWLKEVRYYRVDDELEVRIADASFTYKFDYLPMLTDNVIDANSSKRTFKRLVSTQVTERCYLAASQAVCHFKLGANPYGPAGCGKTETIKTLGHLFGCQVVVHNCDESNDIESLDRLIWGLAHTGLWGCFDEFNRLSSSVLSSVSATLELVQTNIREGRSTVELPTGDIMCIENHSAFFVTLNPGDATRYKGRRRLPTNLRNLFVPVCMERVAVDTIASEYLLALDPRISLNTREALEFGRRLQTWLSEMKAVIGERLTEWDLRLAMAILKRFRMITKNYNNQPRPDKMLVEAIWSEVSSRMGSSDLELLEKSFERSFDNRLDISVDSTTSQELRSAQLANQLESRTGVLVYGPAGSGKSSSWRNLALSRKKWIRWLAMNPKSLDRSRLFGGLDNREQKWCDGLLTKTVREALNILQSDKTIKQVWLILDGPLDPDWIESLNSVMDDNQILTLGSGERLSFCTPSGQRIKLIFETDEVDNISPATVSRLGVVYHDFLQKDLPKSDASNGQEKLKDFMLSENKRLMIVTYKTKKVLNTFMDTLIVDRDNLVEYNCNEYSNSGHLLNLMNSNSLKSLYLLKNVHLIGAQDQWQTRTLLEFIRFIASYNGYYDENMCFQKTGAKFILTSDSLNKLNARLINASTTVELEDSGEQDDRDDIEVPFEDFEPALITDYISNKSSVLTFSCQFGGFELRRRFFRSVLGKQVFEFCDAETIDTTLKIMSKFVETPPVNQSSESIKLFVLTEMQASLMDGSTKGELYHLINMLPSQVKLVYLTNGAADNLEYWRSMGPIVHLTSATATCWSDLRGSIRDQFSGKLSTDCGIKANQIEWLAERVIYFLTQQTVDLSERLKVHLYVDFAADLINKSTKEHEFQQRALSGGLKKLAEFEADIEAQKLKIKREEEKLITRRKEMEILTKTIDEAIKLTVKHREQFNGLREQQAAKGSKIASQQQKLELELSKVIPLIESSKNEVSRYLQPEALNEIKSLRSPPKAIKDILDVLLIILGVNDSSWTSIKSYLTKYSLKDQLTGFDFRKNLNASLLAKVEREIQLRGEAFELEQAARASKAVLPIVGWIKATVEYGRALVKMKPLNNEMDQLQLEAKQLEEEALSTKTQIDAMDERVALDSRRLRESQDEYESSQRSLDELELRLRDVMKMRSDLSSQVDRWRWRLESIRSFLDGEYRLSKLCLAAASLLLFVDDLNSIQDNWFTVTFQLDALTTDQFVRHLLSHLIEDEWLGELTFKHEDTTRIMQLVLLRLSLEYDLESKILLDVGSSNFQLTEEELQQSLSFKGIVTNAAKNVVLIRCNSLEEWKTAVSQVLRPRKMVLLEMTTLEIQLETVRMIMSENSSLGAHLLLVGDYDQLNPSVRRLLRPIRLLQSENSPEDMKSTISRRLMEVFNGNLTDSVDKLEHALQLQRSSTHSKEISLLMRLANMESHQQVATEGLCGNLAEVLGELHDQSEALKRYEITLSSKLEELGTEQRKLDIFCSKAVVFYTSYLADLCASDRFCRMSVERYARLLVAALQSRGDTGGKKSATAVADFPYLFITTQVLLSARPARRHHFLAALQSNQQQVGAKCEEVSLSTCPIMSNVIGTVQDLTKLFQLKTVIGDLLRDEKASYLAQLMIVVHEATRSSPQLEIDELFRCSKDNDWPTCSYRKIYASLNNVGRIEQAILDSFKVKSSEFIRCLCIANSHLIANWINGRLVNLLRVSKTRLLVILVAEEDNEGEQISLDVLNRAQVKCWHDDLAHNAAERYKLLTRLIPTTGLNGNEQRLCRQMVLLHVICQERTKLADDEPGVWNRQYSFDTDQLRMALATLERVSLARLAQLYPTNDDHCLRSEVRNLIESSLYASRMEVQEDEIAMAQLFARILGSEEGEKVLEQLEVRLMEGAKGKTLELLDDLIGSPPVIE